LKQLVDATANLPSLWQTACCLAFDLLLWQIVVLDVP